MSYRNSFLKITLIEPQSIFGQIAEGGRIWLNDFLVLGVLLEPIEETYLIMTEFRKTRRV